MQVITKQLPEVYLYSSRTGRFLEESLELIGCFKGEEEYSYLITDKHYFFSEVVDFCHSENQTNILILGEVMSHGQRKAYDYHISSGHREFIGYWKRVTKDRAMQEESWSKIGDNYYIVQEEYGTTWKEVS